MILDLDDLGLNKFQSNLLCEYSIFSNYRLARKSNCWYCKYFKTFVQKTSSKIAPRFPSDFFTGIRNCFKDFKDYLIHRSCEFFIKKFICSFRNFTRYLFRNNFGDSVECVNFFQKFLQEFTQITIFFYLRVFLLKDNSTLSSFRDFFRIFSSYSSMYCPRNLSTFSSKKNFNNF